MVALKECTLLIIDDKRVSINVLKDLLGSLYRIVVATDPKTASQLAISLNPDLILLSTKMLHSSGFNILRTIKSNLETAQIPVILIYPKTDLDNISFGFKFGAVDYIIEPLELEEVIIKVNTHLSLSAAKNALANQNDILEKKVSERTHELFLAKQATIMSFATLAEYRDNETGEHLKRVKFYVEILAKGLRGKKEYSNILTDEYIDLLIQSCPLHDIGKVGIPDNILLKPGRLTAEEYEIVKLHTTYGRNAIMAVEKDLGELSFLQLAKEVAYTHHEKWDGKGYPLGLKGTDIPLSGRIMALADVYDVLTSRRVYKQAYSHNSALHTIRTASGSHFDPAIVDIFVTNHEKFNAIAARYMDSEKQNGILAYAAISAGNID